MAAAVRPDARRAHAAPRARDRGAVTVHRSPRRSGPCPWWGVLAASMALYAAAAEAPVATELLDFSADEVTRIARHGPWPPARALEAGNGGAGRREATGLCTGLFVAARRARAG